MKRARQRPSSLRGASAPLKTERCSFNSNLGHSYAGKATGVALLFQRSNFQPRLSSRSRDIPRCLQAGWFNSNFRRDEELAALQLLRVKMLHGGALEYGSSNNRQQHSPRSRGIRCVSTSKVGSTPAFTPNFLCLDREHHWPVHPVLTRRGQGSSPWRSTIVFSRCGEVVSHLPWAQGIGGSNPLTSTSSMGARAALPVIARSLTETMRAEHLHLA